MTFTHASYTVAWICALPLELAAAKVFLDQVHPRLAQPQSDHNVYTLGSVGSHNVVVACLPAGVYGTTSATAAVSHLTSTYQNVRFGLLVGVGGGVPRGNPDIRLGDIVVSKPTDTSSGVIQYDYGKTLQTGRLYRTGSLNKPPSLLLKVIAQMESDNMLGKASLSNIMTSSLQKEEICKQFPRPSKDQLFQPTYDHVYDRPDCATCDPSQLVDRAERIAEGPHLHYGLIASGNQVMKDSRTRDLVAQELDILCFEMEAAGLMDEVPSLVIRGICDYCDSHKHKEWQPYAAFVAAAYAKAVLIQVPFQRRADDLEKSTSEKHHWTVPFRKNPGFVGREEEIAKVEEQFEMTNGPFKVALCGLGGVGKTQIALELAYRLRARDPTRSVFWIPCTSNASVEQAFMGIAQTIGPQEVKPSDAKERVKAHLSQINGQKWLLIFDNADDMDMWVRDSAGATELANLLAPSEQGRILFTTRNRKLAVRLASRFVVDISEPDAETGVKILQEALQKKELLENRKETIALLEQLTFLPLAISQAAAYINSNDIGLSDYIALFNEQESDVIELLSEDFGDDGRYHDIQNPVATTWLISFQQVQRLNPLAADYLSFMACINPRVIPQSLLPEAPSRKKKIDAIGLLKAFSFVSEQANNHTLSLHRLVHLSTRSWLRRQRKFSQQIQKTANRLNQVFPNNDHKNQTIWREYLPHVLLLVGELDFQQKREDYIILLQNLGRCLWTDGRYNEAVVLFEDIVKLQQRKRGDSDALALTSMCDLASMYRDQGQLKKAEELGVQVLEIRKRVLEPEHPDTLASMARLALTYRDQGRWKEAEELGVQVLEISKWVLGPEHPNTLIIMGNLALTYLNQGQWKEAEELGVQVLEIRKRVLRPEHPSTLNSMANLALTYSDQGRWKEAEELGVQVIEISKRALGPEHPSTLNSIGNLASTYSKQGQWNKAEELEVQALEIRKRVLGSEHPDTLISIGNLASTYSNQGQWNKAEELEVQVLEIRKRVLGLEHPSTLASMANLALTYSDQGHWKEAEELGVQVLEIRKRVLEPEHPDTLNSMANLALTYRDQGRWKEAEELGVRAIEIRKRVLGPEHPDTLNSMANLALTYRDQGRWKEAEELGVRAIEIQKQVLGPEHPSTLASMANLALAYSDQGRWKEAEELEVRAIEIQKRVLEPEHPDTLASMGNLASTYSNQGRWKEAEKLGVQVLEIRKQVLELGHPNTLTSMANLALAYLKQGRWKEAEELGVQALEIRKRVLGPEHPDTLTSMTNLAHTLYSQENIHEAVVLMGQCVELQGRLLGPSHLHTINSTRSLREWHEIIRLSSIKHESFVQAGNDQPIKDVVQDHFPPAVVVTKANGPGEPLNPHQDLVQPATFLRVFPEAHPLILASRGGSPVTQGHDLHKVD